MARAQTSPLAVTLWFVGGAAAVVLLLQKPTPRAPVVGAARRQRAPRTPRPHQRFVSDLTDAATITWQQHLLAHGKHPLETVLDPRFLGTERGQLAMHHLRQAGVDLTNPWQPPFWDLKRRVEETGRP